ncbi:MAG: hypothetical protein A2Y40_03605 [Candidatus Margulisbacteria bacterium GWF2_35_9]|nr:MAG: hypothetical protein A2Y40_03605 [Candidatus Margulisbacteria bacterium GWF2_35_9]
MYNKVLANKDQKLISGEIIKKEINSFFNMLTLRLKKRAEDNPVLKDVLSKVDLKSFEIELLNLDFDLKDDFRPKVNQLILKFEKTESLVQLSVLLELAKKEVLLTSDSAFQTNGLLNNLLIQGLNINENVPLELVFVQRKNIDGKLSPNNPAVVVDFAVSYTRLKNIVATAYQNKRVDQKNLVDFYHRHVFKKGVSEEKIVSILGGDTTLTKLVFNSFEKSKRDSVWGKLLSITSEKNGDEITINFGKDKDILNEWFMSADCNLSADEAKALLLILKQAQSKGWRRFFINPDSSDNLVFKPHHHQDYIQEASDLDINQKIRLESLRSKCDVPSADRETVERIITDSMTSVPNKHAGKYAEDALKDLGFITIREGGEESSMMWRVKTLIEDPNGSVSLAGKKYREEWTKFGVAGDYDNFTNHNSLQAAYLEGVGLVPLPGDVKIAIITTSLESCTRNIYYAIQNKQSALNRSLTIPEIESIYDEKIAETLADIKSQIIQYECEITGLSEEDVSINFKSWLKHTKPDETHLEVSGSYQCLYGSDNTPIARILGKADRLMNGEKNQGHRGFYKFGMFMEDRGQQSTESASMEVIEQRKYVQDKHRKMPVDNGHKDLDTKKMLERDFLSGSYNISAINQFITQLPEGQNHIVFTVSVSKLMKLLNELLDHLGGDFNIKLEGNILRDIAQAMKGPSFSGKVYVGYRFDPIMLISGGNADIKRMKIKLQKYLKQRLIAEIFDRMAGLDDSKGIKPSFIKTAKKFELDSKYIKAINALVEDNISVTFAEQSDKEINYYCFKDLWGIDDSGAQQIPHSEFIIKNTATQ